jgi:hypothetical protein
MSSPLLQQLPTQEPVVTRPPSLVTKLAQVMGAIGHVKKRGRNEHFKYDFATEADIADAIRGELAQRNVILVPAIVTAERIEIGRTSSGVAKVLTELHMLMTFYDGDSTDTISKPWRGAGVDSEDKGLYKAITGGEKYFLLKTFLIPTGDDPEREDKDTKTSREKATAKPDRDTRQARKAIGPLPDGVVYIEKVIPKTNGARDWVEIVTSTGEELIAFEPGCMALATQLAQEACPVEIVTSLNSKGKTQIDEISRWRPAGAAPASPIPPVTVPKGNDVGF